MRDDARLRAELGYCVPHGVPHSTFLSWSTDDQDKALAWVGEQALACAGCGTRADEWDPASGGSRFAYVAEPRRCPGCESLAQAQRELQSSDEEHLGVRLALIPNPEEVAGG